MKQLSYDLDKSFEDFQKDFYSRFPDSKIFSVGRFNLIKVILDGLKVNYIEKDYFRTNFSKPKIIVVVFSFLKLLQLKFIERNEFYIDKSADVLVFGTPRKSEIRSGSVWFYFHKIIESIGRNRIVLCSSTTTNNGLTVDFKLENTKHFAFEANTSEENKLREGLLKLLKKLSHCVVKSDLQNIEIAFQIFFFN